MERVAYLVFLGHDFEKEHNEKKIVSILRRTFAKVLDKGREC